MDCVVPVSSLKESTELKCFGSILAGLGRLLGKELTPQCDRILALQGSVGQVRDLLSGFRSSQPELYAQLWG